MSPLEVWVRLAWYLNWHTVYPQLLWVAGAVAREHFERAHEHPLPRWLS